MFFFNRKKNKKQAEENSEKMQEENEKLESSEEETTAEEKETEEKPREEATAQDDFPEEGAAHGEETNLVGFALFKDKNFDMNVIAEDMKEDADFTIEVQEAEHPTFVIKTEEGTFVCTHLPMPVPNGEVQSVMPFNALDKETIQDVQNHQAFVVISRLKEPFKNRMRACTDFTKIASVLMRQTNAAAMYMGDTKYLLSPDRYAALLGQIMQATHHGEDLFPMPLWIKMSMFKSEKGIRAITSGLKGFGLYELGFADSKRLPDDIYSILMNTCDMYLVEKCQFQDGDSMRLDPKTEAVFELKGDTLFIVEKHKDVTE